MKYRAVSDGDFKHVLDGRQGVLASEGLGEVSDRQKVNTDDEADNNPLTSFTHHRPDLIALTCLHMDPVICEMSKYSSGMGCTLYSIAAYIVAGDTLALLIKVVVSLVQLVYHVVSLVQVVPLVCLWYKLYHVVSLV